MRRKRQRTPHPDPAAELQLLRILDLRAGIDRRASMTMDMRHEIGQLNHQARMEGQARMQRNHERVDVLTAQIAVLEREIERVHGMIATLQAQISPDDLAYL